MRSSLDKLLLNMIGLFGSIVIRVMMRTLRITVEGEEKLQEIPSRNGKVIYALWHGQLFMHTYYFRKRNIHPVISEHRDGEMIAQITRRMGYVPIRGSSTRGGVKVLLRILTKLGNRYDLAITPDGPRGPRWKVQQGVIFLAQKTGLPIIPIVTGTDRFWELKSWDRFRIPKPFSKALLLYGDPIFIPAELEREGHVGLMKKLENNMFAMSIELEKRLGIHEAKG
jgi:lysophospholipid acyltransferase (LPLAT)-like uncharacterized protein